jgi:Tannase and feruloyl esterase
MNHQLEREIYLIAAVFLSFGASPSRASAAECAQSAIQAISPSNTMIVSATPQSDRGYCDVIAYVTTLHPGPNQVNFELTLPFEGNGRFLFIGNGGFAGSLNFPEVFPDFESIPDLTKAGFAIAFTDTGHQGSFLDGSWALFDQAKQDDFLFRGVHVAAVAAKAITNNFYGRQSRAYFAGCSDGGREALVEAERFATDFDGLLAGDPAIGAVTPGFNWNQQHLTATAHNYLSTDKLALVDAEVLKSCDAADGVPDGLIQDPRRCTFDPARLLCVSGDGSDCLTSGQVESLRAVYSGATKKEGHTVYSGLSESDSAGDGSWGTWTTGLVPPDAPGTPEPWSDLGLAPWQFLIQDQVLKFFVFGDPAYNSLSFNLNSDDLARTHKVMNRGGAEGANPDLSFFQNRGGKLIIYSGWSDPAVSPEETIRYYNSVVQQQGRLDRTQRFARLFMAPGMQHCIGSGPGPNVFNPLTSLIDWVEKNVAPKNITAAHFQDNDLSTGIVTRTMPLCPYPERAEFKGGDVNVASNWSCRRTEQ